MKKVLSAFNNRASYIAGSVMLLVGSGSAAFATVDPNAYDPTAVTTEVTTWLTGVLIPGMIGLFVLGITVRLAFKWIKKFAKAV